MTQEERETTVDAIIAKMTEASQAKGFNAALKIMSQLGDMIEEVWQNGYKQVMSEQRTFIENKQLN